MPYAAAWLLTSPVVFWPLAKGTVLRLEQRADLVAIIVQHSELGLPN